ncbi:ABC transporter ATP-binding protein [Tumebacillus lipolyticus]|uniref:ABC transporter ATP-binding protein n=1 Tax=Tumebacillus lipolyticus TaxID=1280370 RepID=A0ABW4ZTP0_9BACL
MTILFTDLGKAMRFVWQHGKMWVTASVLFMMLLGIVPIATLWVMKELINTVAGLIQYQPQAYSQALWLLILQFAITVSASLLQNVQRLIDQTFEFRLDHHLQNAMIGKTISVPLTYFDLPDFYHHLNRISGNQGTRFLSPVSNLFLIGKSLITLFSYLTFLFSIHWSLVLLSSLAAVPILLVQSKFGVERFHLIYQQTPMARDAKYTASLLWDRQSAKEIRLFSLGEHLRRRWSEKYIKNIKEVIKLSRRQHSANIGLDAVTALFYGGAAGIIVWLIRTTSLKIGDFVAVGQAVQGTQGAINQTAGLFASIYQESLFIGDFFRFLEYEVPGHDKQKGTRPFPVPLEQGICFDNVSYRYVNSERDTLREVSFMIHAGEKVAIVGENGSGKTTLVKCLMGLYPVSGGQIYFDQSPSDELANQEIYKNITVIFQDFMKYAYTIRENIVFGDIEKISESERMEAASVQTGAASFVQRFEKGYDTMLGRFLADGEDLSGGQWQKIALARAMFASGQIMVLDEPTAALDPDAEMEVFRQFQQLTQNKTTIFISHRMAAARMADRIIVMKDGRVAEMGTHLELTMLDGEYARMYRMQAQWFTDKQDYVEV